MGQQSDQPYYIVTSPRNHFTVTFSPTRQSSYTYTQSMHVEVSVSVQTCTAIYNEPLLYRTAYAATCHVVRPHAGMAETLKLPQSGPSSWSSHLEPDSRRGPELAPPYTVHTAHPCGQYGSQGRPRGVTTGVRACGSRTGYNAVRRRAQGGGEGPKGPPRSNPGGAQIEVSHHFRIWAVAHHTLAVACMELLKLSSCASMATTEEDSAVPLGCGLTEGVPQHTAHGTRHTAHGTRHTAHGTRVQLAESPDPAMFSA
jgi:hypothetical protein